MSTDTDQRMDATADYILYRYPDSQPRFTVTWRDNNGNTRTMSGEVYDRNGTTSHVFKRDGEDTTTVITVQPGGAMRETVWATADYERSTALMEKTGPKMQILAAGKIADLPATK